MVSGIRGGSRIGRAGVVGLLAMGVLAAASCSGGSTAGGGLSTAQAASSSQSAFDAERLEKMRAVCDEHCSSLAGLSATCTSAAECLQVGQRVLSVTYGVATDLEAAGFAAFEVPRIQDALEATNSEADRVIDGCAQAAVSVCQQSVKGLVSSAQSIGRELKDYSD